MQLDPADVRKGHDRPPLPHALFNPPPVLLDFTAPTLPVVYFVRVGVQAEWCSVQQLQLKVKLGGYC